MVMGRCCCPESCYVVNSSQLHYSDDFFNVFSSTGDYDVSVNFPEILYESPYIVYDKCDLSEPPCEHSVPYWECNSYFATVLSNYIIFNLLLIKKSN